MLNVFKPGTKVHLSVGWTEAPIIVMVRSFCYGPDDYLRYEIIYWDHNGERQQIWVDQNEVVLFLDTERLEIGFIST